MVSNSAPSRVHCTLHDGGQNYYINIQQHLRRPRDLGLLYIGLRKGILFLTSALLVSGQNSRRLEEIIQWLASGMSTSSSASRKKQCWEMEQKCDGCIIFDEAHKVVVHRQPILG